MVSDQIYGYQQEELITKESTIKRLKEKLSQNEKDRSKNASRSQNSFVNVSDPNQKSFQTMEEKIKKMQKSLFNREEEIKELRKRVRNEEINSSNNKSIRSKTRKSGNEPFLKANSRRENQISNVEEKEDLESVLKQFDDDNFNIESNSQNKLYLMNSMRSIKNDLKRFQSTPAYEKGQLSRLNHKNKKILQNIYLRIINMIDFIQDDIQIQFPHLREKIYNMGKILQKLTSTLRKYKEVMKSKDIDQANKSDVQSSYDEMMLRSSNFLTYKRESKNFKSIHLQTVKNNLETEMSVYKEFTGQIKTLLIDCGDDFEDDDEIELVYQKLSNQLYKSKKALKNVKTKEKVIRELTERIEEYKKDLEDKETELEIFEENVEYEKKKNKELKKKNTEQEKKFKSELKELEDQIENQRALIDEYNIKIQEQKVFIGQFTQGSGPTMTVKNNEFQSFKQTKYSENLVSTDFQATSFGKKECFGIEHSIEDDYVNNKNEAAFNDSFKPVKDSNMNPQNKFKFVDESQDNKFSGFRLNNVNNHCDTFGNLEDNKPKTKNVFDDSSMNIDSILGGKKNTDFINLASEKSLDKILHPEKNEEKELKRVSEREMDDDSEDDLDDLLMPKKVDVKENLEDSKTEVQKNRKQVNYKDIKLFNFKKE